MISPLKLKELYDQGTNISDYLKNNNTQEYKSSEIIELSYDLQSGSYSRAMQNQEYAELKNKLAGEIANKILSYCKPGSILETGIGEGTTLSGVLKHLPSQTLSFGFDLSWSRIAYAQLWLKQNDLNNTLLCTGDMLNIPFLDNSIDVVYTAHSIEPNGGNEENIIKELYRVTGRYLIMVEPEYDIASDEGKERMDRFGYCKKIKNICEKLDYNILEHSPLQHNLNPLNPVAVTVIQKSSTFTRLENVFACPVFKTPLTRSKGNYFSEEALSIYPVIDGIPCLRIENSILASKYLETT